MVFVIDDTLFDGRSTNVDLLAFFRSAALRRHTVVLCASPPALAKSPSIDTPTFARWLAALPDRLHVEARLLRERSARISASTLAVGANRIVVSDEPRQGTEGCWLTLDEAVRAASEPLHLIVENQINDAAFLRRLLPPSWRQKFEDWERQGQLRYQNGGGLPVMSTLVEFFTDDAKARQYFGLPAEVWKLVHFLLYDHDGDSETSPGEHSSKLEQCCTRNGMGRHQHRLERRDAEHYLPEQALKSIAHHRLHDKPADRERLLKEVDAHLADQNRHFAPLPRIGGGPFFKNEFNRDLAWSDEWFARDGAWPEMTRLAERLASAI